MLSVEIYKHFENSKDYGFRDQIQRAFVSVMNNIAEGFEPKTNMNSGFLFVAKGSCGEVRSMMILAQELNKINKDQAQPLQVLAEEISRMISGLIKTL